MPTSINLPENLLRLKPLREGFVFRKGLSKIESRFESGKTYSKRTAIKANDRFSAKLFVSESQRQDFLNFYSNTLDEGTKTFNWSHPLSGAQIETLIVGAPEIEPVGALNYNISLEFEIVS